MNFLVILFLPFIVTVVHGVPIGNVTSEIQSNVVQSVQVVNKESQSQISGTVIDKETAGVVTDKKSPVSEEVFGTEGAVEDSSSGETTTLQPQSDSGERVARQLEEEDDEEGNADDDDDEEEDDGEEEEEEEERKLPPGKVAVKPGSKKKAPIGKPVPILVEGVEDDEAEDLGIFEREEVKSDEKSDEEKSEEQHDEDDEESGEDDDRNERPTGLIAEPSSNERGDVFENPVLLPSQNEGSEQERPLAVAVVEREEEIRDPVPMIVEDLNTPSEDQTSKLGENVDKSGKNKPKKETEDDDDDEEEDEEEEEEEAARSEKASQARAAYPSPVLYYYPFPESSVAPASAH